MYARLCPQLSTKDDPSHLRSFWNFVFKCILEKFRKKSGLSFSQKYNPSIYEGYIFHFSIWGPNYILLEVTMQFRRGGEVKLYLGLDWKLENPTLDCLEKNGGSWHVRRAKWGRTRSFLNKKYNQLFYCSFWSHLWPASSGI